MRIVVNSDRQKERLLGRIALGAALALLAGYLGLAWAVLKKSEEGRMKGEGGGKP